MKLEGYKSGIYTRVEDYRAFILSKINYNWSWEDTKINKVLEEASRRLGELNSYSLLVPNMDVYIKMFEKTEIANSYNIDGIDVKIEEFFGESKETENEKLYDIRSLENYERTIALGKEKISNSEEIDTKLLLLLHKNLIEGTKEENKNPGRFRTSQNWIGGVSPKEASFVPPPHTEVEECLMDFEKFVKNNDTDTPELVKIAMLHYQFETIHPFLSANGRIGRMLIPLYMQSKGMLEKSCLYISKFLKDNQSTYFAKLTKVRDTSDMIGWIKFFLTGVLEIAKKQKEQILKLEELSKEIEKIINELPVKPENARKAVEVLYNEPIASRKRILENSKMKPSTLNTTINSLLEKNMIEEITGQGRNQIFAFRKYMNIFLE
ncbi:MAG: Fic family protein [Clostridia bacterium]|nr:Fic family protein [Clostridia bacterium]